MSGRDAKYIRVLSGLAGAGAALGLGGCADLMERSTIAPDWFQAKAVEVKGEGYPDLKDVPKVRGNNAGGIEASSAEAEALKSEADKIEAENNAVGAIPTDEELRARAARLRAELEAGETAATRRP